jgi:transposase-like protein
VNAAKSFLRSAMKNTRVPTKITLDAYAASHRAVREMKEDGELPGRVKGVQHPEQLGAQQFLGRNRRPARGRVQRRQSSTLPNESPTAYRHFLQFNL